VLLRSCHCFGRFLCLLMGRQKSVYEFLVNCVVQASDLENAKEIIESKQWLNYRDEYNSPRGNVVFLFPQIQEPKGNIERIQVIGAIPLVQGQGQARTPQFNQYIVAFAALCASPTVEQASAYLNSMLWFNSTQVANYVGHTAPREASEISSYFT